MASKLGDLLLVSTVLLLEAAMAGCNQPPEITQVGDYQIADSFFDYLHDDVAESVSFAVYAGETLTLRVVAVDPEGGPVHYVAGPLPIGAEFDEHKGVFTWTPSFEQGEAGEWVDLYLVAMDDQGAWDAVVATVTVYTTGPPDLPGAPKNSWGTGDTASSSEGSVPLFSRPMAPSQPWTGDDESRGCHDDSR